MSFNIRFSTDADLAQIVSIYNQAILKGEQTADIEIFKTIEKKEWYTEHQNNQYPILVAENAEKIIGWISLSPYRKGRKALDGCAEISLYIDEVHTGKGIGSAMLGKMIEHARRKHIVNVVAFLIATNKASKALFQKFSFELWGRLPQIVAYKNEHLDHLIFGKNIE